MLVSMWVERHTALASMQVRLSELRARRLDPRDVDTLGKMLAAAPDPQAGLLVAGDNDATLRLESFIRSVAKDHRAEVLSISLVTDTVGGKLPILRGNLHFVVGDESVGSFVKSLETGSPTVFLEHLRIAQRSAYRAESEALMLDLSTSILVYRDIPAAGRSKP